MSRPEAQNRYRDDRRRWPTDEADLKVTDSVTLPRETSPYLIKTSAPTSNDQIDLASIVEMVQLVSSEIVPDRLIRSLMQVVMQNADAQRGVLIMCDETTARIVSEAITRSGEVVVLYHNELSGNTRPVGVPEALVTYVMRTQQTVTLNDASLENPFASDGYFRNNAPRSILGLPLVKHGRLVALLYLENRSTRNAFTAERLIVLKLLASQAAISLDNMLLYKELQEREAKVRRLVDTNIIGVAICGSEGRFTEANAAFLQATGYSRADLASRGLRWLDLVPAESKEEHARLLADTAKYGIVQPVEREYQRKDGSRVTVLLGCASLDDTDTERVVFVIDLTDQKRAEVMLRKTTAELDHMMRVMTVGELGASIAHEANQPLTAIVANASALLQWLETTPPNLTRAHETARWIMRDGEWAADVIRGLKALSKKTLGLREPVDLNKSIEEVLPLIQSELRHHGIILTFQPVDGPFFVLGDRVQLQQVVLNLLKNSIDSMAGVHDRSRELLIATYNLDGESVGVLVRDTGHGVDPDITHRIFERFYTTKADGMGIGLSISRSIVQKHEGQLWAAANHDFGMTFEFTIPAYKPRE